jgi:hypothetical protein
MKDEEKLFKMFIALLETLNKLIDSNQDDSKVKTKEEKHAVFEKVYKKLEDNWILDGDVLVGLLKYYIELKDMNKCSKIAIHLVRYYRPKIDEVYKIWSDKEEYEKCQTLKMMLNSLD